tara:strand:+ start:513 stop:776 length:264 start_codon:yes stop_codon:yes gene_type:complete
LELKKLDHGFELVVRYFLNTHFARQSIKVSRIKNLVLSFDFLTISISGLFALGGIWILFYSFDDDDDDEGDGMGSPLLFPLYAPSPT